MRPVGGFRIAGELVRRRTPAWVLGGLVLTGGLLGLWAAALAGSAAALPSNCSQSGTQVVCRFSYTGAAQSFDVPAGVGSVTVDAFGAQGGSGQASFGGLGGEAKTTLSVNGGDVLEVLAGGQGGCGSGAPIPCGSHNGAGGFNGGGAGGAPGTGSVNGTSQPGFQGSGGGGASDVRTGSCAQTLSCGLSARVLVAGGGGGSVYPSAADENLFGQGGGGGNPTGDTGDSGSGGAGGGGGGSQTAGGSNGTAGTVPASCDVAAPQAGTAGGTVTQDAGGAGGAGGSATSNAEGNGGSGGGGGYWGGGGGGGICGDNPAGAGGGGSSFGPTGATFTSATQSGDGQVTITYSLPYTIAAFGQPINDPMNPMSVFKGGSTIPVKFQLTDQNGNPIDDTVGSAIAASCQATISLTYIGSSSGPVDEAIDTASTDTGNCFRYDPTAHQFIFNLKTKGLSTGTYTITANVTGYSPSHYVYVGLR